MNKETILIIYLIVLLIYIIIKSVIFYRKYKVNPLSFMKSSFKEAIYWWGAFLILLIYGVILVLTFLGLFGSIIQNKILDFAGLIILTIGFVILIIAHAQMGKSWRMGIDKKIKIKIVSAGLFSYTRNPVYFGLMIQSLGILLLIPNITTLTLFVLLVLDLNFIVRSEEKFLEKQFGREYLNYKKKVRRFI